MLQNVNVRVMVVMGYLTCDLAKVEYLVNTVHADV